MTITTTAEETRVPTRQQDGVTVVQVADVRAYAARRAALKVSKASAGSAVTAPTPRPVGTGDAGSDRARGIERTGVSGTSESGAAEFGRVGELK